MFMASALSNMKFAPKCCKQHHHFIDKTARQYVFEINDNDKLDQPSEVMNSKACPGFIIRGLWRLYRVYTYVEFH